jgi:N-acetyl-anhydromuramyl-L-alanine amidase AmpD
MKFSGATWHAVQNYTKGGQDAVLGVVVHIMDGTLEGSQSWFNNPVASASSHFGTGKDGELRQWVDTADRAWAQAAGNRTYLSVENEGRGGDALTKAQITANAKVLAWAHEKYGVPLKLAKHVGDNGLAYHALGGSAWGGHTSCPGSKIVAQLDDIVAKANEIAYPTEEDSMDPFDVWNYKGKGEDSDVYAYVRNTKAKLDVVEDEVALLKNLALQQGTQLVALTNLVKAVSAKLDTPVAKTK